MSARQCPEEVLDEIFASVESHKDLINLACASRSFASLLIPHHTEYRVIQTARPIPAVWAHLAQRPDLTGNIREVHMVWADSPDRPVERVPKSLITAADGAAENKEEKKRVENACKSLALMKRLTTFVWLGLDDIPSTYQLSLLKELTDKMFLAHLCLSFAMLPSDDEEQNRVEEQRLVWKSSSLKHLDFVGDEWLQSPNRHIYTLFKTSATTIKALSLPSIVLGEFALTLHLPALEVLYIVWDHANNDLKSNICHFLQNHPSITNLSWWSPGAVNLAQGALPNLKSISGKSPLLYALEGAHKGTYRLKIQSLRVRITVEELNELTCLDRHYLRQHVAVSYQSFNAIYRMAELFPALMEISLQYTDWKQQADATLERCYDIVQSFKNLEILSGEALYVALQWSPVQIQEHVLKTASLCPKLKEMDSYIRPTSDGIRLNGPLRVYIIRQNLPVDSVSEGILSSPVPIGTIDAKGERISYQIREIWSGKVIFDSTVKSNIRWNSV